MEKKYFVLHLLPSRSDFAQTMNDEERSIMMKHVAYWSVLMKNGSVVVFGPVFDPKATYGLGVVCVSSLDELQEMIANDPAATINRYEYFPMMAMVPDVQS